MFTQKEKDMIVIALQMRRNYVQTNTVNLTPIDMANLSKQALDMMGAKIQLLEDSQIQLLVDTKALIHKIEKV